MAENSNIPANRETIHRLSSYRKVLGKMADLGFQKVFSDNLGDALGVSAPQVRKDFSVFGLTGNKKGGYQVVALLARLNEILGKNEVQKIIIVGCGKLGTALMGHNRFVREGIKVVAGFDADPAIINPEAQIPVFALSELPRVVAAQQVRIAIMAVPEAAAGHVFEELQKSQVRGVLNFTATQLKSTESCVVHNVNLALEIENLFYFAGRQGMPPADIAGAE